MFDKTMTFSVNEDKEAELKKNLTIIYDALMQKGYNPINQIVGYILSDEPDLHNNIQQCTKPYPSYRP